MKSLILLGLGMICILIAAFATPVSIVWFLIDFCGSEDQPFKESALTGLYLWLKMIAFVFPGMVFYFWGVWLEATAKI